MSIRGNIARRAAGGPQFRLQPDKILVEVDGAQNLSRLAEEATNDENRVLESRPVKDSAMKKVRSQLNELGFNTKGLDNLGIVVAETDNLEKVANHIVEASNTFDANTVQRVQKSLNRARQGNTSSATGGFRPGMLNFGSPDKARLEANLRNELSNLNLKNPITDALTDIGGVFSAEMNYSRNTPGPRNLNLDVASNARDVRRAVANEEGEDDKPDVGDALEKMGVKEAWQIDTGERAVAAIFDTAFCRDFFQEDLVLDTFHGDDVESAFSAPEEGHGTMTGYSMAGNKRGHDLTYHGVAKDSEVLLARLSDKDGGLVYVAEAWDWLIGWIKRLDRPVISNHSYGVPLCSAVTMENCTSTTTKLARLMNQRPDHQAFYAAGNEALYCGHRVGGLTNGINGINSDDTSITCAAFRYDLQDAQNYSSHGFGTCSSVDQNPKPDLGCLLPTIVPYGCKEKDMGMGVGGSGGGTSEATPLTAGVATLIASVTGTARRSVIENVLEGTADQVRKTQVNFIRNHDARFGNGQVNAKAALEQAAALAPDVRPTAAFTYSPDTPNPEEIVNFNAASSSDPDNDITSYRWDFDNGNTATGPQAAQEFEEPGNYNVQLTVTDSRGNEDTETQVVVVQGPPEAEFTAEPENPAEGDQVTFDASASSDPNEDIQSYTWNFDDGTTDEGPVVTHTFEEVGEYEVVLTVEDSVEQSDTTSEEVGVSAAASSDEETQTAGLGLGILSRIGR